MGSRPARVAWWIGWSLLRAIWIGAMVAAPLFGFWLASSLAAYNNASQWLALLVGLLLFPLVPVGWELVFVWRRSRHKAVKPAILTRLDRLVLRTLIVNGLFLGGMLYFAHHTAFRALAVRGDWMLDGHDGPIASAVRGTLLGLADRLDSHDTDAHYGKSDDAPDPSTVKPPEPEPPRPPPEPNAPPSKEPPKTAVGWPYPDAADPLVTGMPEADQASIATVGAYLAAKFPDKKLRVKAIHDFVVLRLTYDEDAKDKILAGDHEHVPPQTAEDSFARHTAVCEGYSRLMVALGKAAGVEIAYITGHIRDAKRRILDEASAKAALSGVGHAWNAVLLDGRWLLIDATWDDPTGDKPTLESTYLFTPPELFSYSHLPTEPLWQLVPDPMSVGDFARQPMLSPEIGKLGVTLVDPKRSQVSVGGDIKIVLDNPFAAVLSAVAKLDGDKDGESKHCTVEPGKGTQVEITCELGSGEYEIQLFGGPNGVDKVPGTTSYSLDYFGSILANSR